MYIMILARSWDHQLIGKCDPRKWPVEINREKRDVLPLRRPLWSPLRQKNRHLVAHFLGSSGAFGEGRERARKGATRWLGRQGSNLGSRDQSPLPYRLATPQSVLCERYIEGVVLPASVKAGNPPGSTESSSLAGFPSRVYIRRSSATFRSVAQSGSAPRSGRGGRRFKSCHSDQGSEGFGDFGRAIFSAKYDAKLTLSRCRMPFLMRIR